MRTWILFLLGLFLLSGCTGKQTSTPAPLPLEIFSISTSTNIPVQILPTVQTPTASLKLEETGVALRPSATPACFEDLEFVADLTIPDGTIVARGALIDKRWEVKNSGTCNWGIRYRLKIISGTEMGLQAEQALFPARGGASAMIRMLLLAPDKPGVYRSAWQAISPQGEAFGDIIYVEIRVN